jgi:hypothetical protein
LGLGPAQGMYWDAVMRGRVQATLDKVEEWRRDRYEAPLKLDISDDMDPGQLTCSRMHSPVVSAGGLGLGRCWA